jgi:hypothetical protein
MPATSPGPRRERGEAGDELVERVGRLMRTPCTPPPSAGPAAAGRGGQVAHRAAHADQARPDSRATGARSSLLMTCAVSLSSALRDAGPLPGQEALGHAHRAELPGVRGLREAPGDLDELHGAAAEVQDAAVGERGGVHRRQVAVAGLLGHGEDPDRQGRPPGRPAQERPRRSTRRGWRTWRPRPRPGRPARSRGRSARRRRGPRARGASAPRRAPPWRPGPPRSARPRRSRPCAATRPPTRCRRPGGTSSSPGRSRRTGACGPPRARRPRPSR